MLQQYLIPFTGLKLGKHLFKFDVNDSFFNEFEYSIIKKASLTVDVELEKQETMLILDFNISGDVICNCDLCLADFPFPITRTERQIVKFADDNDDHTADTEEITVLKRTDHEIDLSKLIYEFVNISAPYVSRCADEGNTNWCDKAMIDKLNALNRSTIDNDTDPRWEILKHIKN